MLFIGNSNMINSWSLLLWNPQSSVRRKQGKGTAVLRESHVNIMLSTLNLTCIYIMNTQNSPCLSPESYMLSGFYSHYVIGADVSQRASYSQIKLKTIKARWQGYDS